MAPNKYQILKMLAPQQLLLEVYKNNLLLAPMLFANALVALIVFYWKLRQILLSTNHTNLTHSNKHRLSPNHGYGKSCLDLPFLSLVYRFCLVNIFWKHSWQYNCSSLVKNKWCCCFLLLLSPTLLNIHL